MRFCQTNVSPNTLIFDREIDTESLKATKSQVKTCVGPILDVNFLSLQKCPYKYPMLPLLLHSITCYYFKTIYPSNKPKINRKNKGKILQSLLLYICNHYLNFKLIDSEQPESEIGCDISMAKLYTVFLVLLLVAVSSFQAVVAVRSLKGEQWLKNESLLFMVLPGSGPSCISGNPNIHC